MPIVLRLDRMMADRKISLNELSEKVGIANVNLSKIKTGKVSAIRFSTLEAMYLLKRAHKKRSGSNIQLPPLRLVGMTGFEPAAPWSQTTCATKLRYIPIC